MRPIIIGTRGSSLALCQAGIIRDTLMQRAPRQPVELKVITAQADRNPDLPLVAMSGEGVFVKELEAALLDGQVDCAVHSMKDLPLQTPPGLRLAAVCERREVRDALISRTGDAFEQLPKEARIGTSSPRRRSQLLRLRPDLRMCDIRGNVDTRLRKLGEDQYDAIILAACGLIRLGLQDRITAYLDASQLLPEPGQGALAIETRTDDARILELVGGLDEPVSRACVEAERAFLRALGGGCRVPIAAYASCADGVLELDGAVLAADGHDQRRGTETGPVTEPIAVGERLANYLASQGARELLMRP